MKKLSVISDQLSVKAMLAVMMILALASCGRAASVYFNLKDLTGTAVTNRKVLLTPTSTPQISGASIIVGDNYSFSTDTNGVYTLATVAYGTYRVRVFGFGGDTVFSILVPDSTNSYNVTNLITAVTVPDAGATYSRAAADGRFVQVTNGAGIGNAFSNVTLQGNWNAAGATNLVYGPVVTNGTNVTVTKTTNGATGQLTYTVATTGGGSFAGVANYQQQAQTNFSGTNGGRYGIIFPAATTNETGFFDGLADVTVFRSGEQQHEHLFFYYSGNSFNGGHATQLNYSPAIIGDSALAHVYLTWNGDDLVNIDLAIGPDVSFCTNINITIFGANAGILLPQGGGSQGHDAQFDPIASDGFNTSGGVTAGGGASFAGGVTTIDKTTGDVLTTGNYIKGNYTTGFTLYSGGVGSIDESNWSESFLDNLFPGYNQAYSLTNIPGVNIKHAVTYPSIVVGTAITNTTGFPYLLMGVTALLTNSVSAITNAITFACTDASIGTNVVASNEDTVAAALTGIDRRMVGPWVITNGVVFKFTATGNAGIQGGHVFQ